MKTLLIFLLGIVVGALGWRYYERTYEPTVAQRAGNAAEQTREAAANVRDKTAAGAREIGENLGDAGIVALIKGKYMVEKDLSSLAISVACDDGHVTLTGNVASAELIARATEIARKTAGVTGVTSRLEVKS